MPPTPAQWSVNRSAFAGRVDPDGIARVGIPLRDRGVLVGTLELTMTPGRQLLVEWVAEPGAEPLSDFRAWSKVKL